MDVKYIIFETNVLVGSLRKELKPLHYTQEARAVDNDEPVQEEPAANATVSLSPEVLLRIHTARDVAIRRRDAAMQRVARVRASRGEDVASAATAVNNVVPVPELGAHDNDEVGAVNNQAPDQVVWTVNNDAPFDHSLADRSKCLVCLQVLPLEGESEAGEVTIVCCEHTFHSYCIRTWCESDRLPSF